MKDHLSVLASFLSGAIVGSFLNVCIYRIPREISLISPLRSFCPHCDRAIPWQDNIPLLSWLALRGRCGHCGKPIGWRYPIVELLTAVLFAKAASLTAFPVLLSVLVLLSLLIVVTFIDFEFFLIPDVLSKGGLAAGLVLSLLTPQLHHTSSALIAIGRAIAGALGGALILFIVTELGKLAFGRYKVKFDASRPFSFETASDGDPKILIDGEAFAWSDHFFRKSDRILVRADEVTLNGTEFKDLDLKFHVDRIVTDRDTIPLAKVINLSGKMRYAEFPREAMGLGDVKLIAAIGAFIGLQGVLFTIPAASVLGAAFGLTALAFGKREWSARIPFGPYLAAGAVIWLFWGHQLLSWYTGLLS
jgi:leader peptidase (prepilin peptidase) / N-methyltransferase